VWAFNFRAPKSLPWWLFMALALHAAGVQAAGPTPSSTPSSVPASTPNITDEDLERVRREQPTITEQDIERARQTYLYGAPGGTQLQVAPATASPRIDALPQPISPPAVLPSLEALAKGYAIEGNGADMAQGLAAGPGLMVFVSLSMPQPSLQRLVDQAARAKASVFIRGLVDGSLRQTVSQVQGLIGSRQVAIQIDPQAFDRFSIEKVPSFVLVRDGTRPASCASGTCAPPKGFVRTSGDVSLDYALEFMQRGAPGFSKDAALFLRRIKR